MLSKEIVQEELDSLAKQRERTMEILAKVEDERKKAVRFLHQVEGGEAVLRKLLGKLERPEPPQQEGGIGTLNI